MTTVYPAPNPATEAGLLLPSRPGLLLPSAAGSPIDQEYPLLQTQCVIQFRELPIERPQWQIPDLSCDLQHEAV